jgi:hypothetical protein
MMGADFDAETLWALAQQRQREWLQQAEREALRRQCAAHQPQRHPRLLRVVQDRFITCRLWIRALQRRLAGASRSLVQEERTQAGTPGKEARAYRAEE